MTDKIPHLAGIILAAGMSSRMGETKQLLPMGDGTILEQVIKTCQASVLCETIVVLGHEASTVRDVIHKTGVVHTVNPDYRQGISTSIRQGLSVVKPSVKAAVFLLGDQPLVRPQTVDFLVNAYLENAPLIVCPAYKGKRGNPVLFDRRLFARLMSLSGDRGGSALFKEFAHSTGLVEVDDAGILLDIDTKEDYEKSRY